MVDLSKDNLDIQMPVICSIRITLPSTRSKSASSNLAVRKLKNDMKGPIFVVVGPPVWVRHFANIRFQGARKKDDSYLSCGVRDEADSGTEEPTSDRCRENHQSHEKSLTNNPVIVLDEIDVRAQIIEEIPLLHYWRCSIQSKSFLCGSLSRCSV